VGSLAMVASGGDGMSAWSGWPPGAPATSTAPDVVSAGGATVLAVTSATEVSAAVAFFGPSGTVLNAAFGQPVRVAPGSWVTLPDAQGIAPKGSAWVSVGIEVWATSLGQTLLVDHPELSSVRDHVARVVGPLRTHGNRVLEGNGRAITFRGIDLTGLQGHAALPNVSRQTFVQMRQWGANFVRIDLGEQLWLHDSCAYSPGYEDEVAKIVRWVTSLGMVALLDLHWNNPADLDASAGSCPAAGQQVMPDKLGSVAFWRQVAKRFAGNRLVAFDLYNEPYGVTGSVWRDGGSVGSYQAVGMQRLYDVVRRTGARNLIVASGLNWANNPPSDPIAGTNVVYSAHVYTCPQDPPPACTTAKPYDPDAILGQWRSFARSHPVMVGEFGWPNSDEGSFNANVIQFVRNHGWAGWDVYAWDGTDSGLFDLVASAPASGTVEPSPAGMPVLAAMARTSSAP
jgi:endoglucanase